MDNELKPLEDKYQLYCPGLCNKDEIDKTSELMELVLGYTKEEIQKFKNRDFDAIIAYNLSLEIAKRITSIFSAYNLQIYLHENSLNFDTGSKGYWWKDFGGLYSPRPIEDYGEMPLVKREQLNTEVKYYCTPLPKNLMYKQTTTQNQITCPYCKSTNVSKITAASKAAHTALFGVFSISRNSKNYHCNSCRSDF